MTILDAAPLEQFASALWEPDDLVEIRPLPTTAGRRRWLPAREVPTVLAALQQENDGGADLYAGVLPRTVQGGGSAEHTDGGRVIWIDCDHIAADAALARVRAAEVPAPVLVVDSGHGAHVYWRLTEKLPREAHTRLLKAVHAWLARDPELAAHLDAKTQEPARIMRLPGFLNHKPPPAPCRVIHYAPEAVCDARDWTPALLAYTPDPERPRAPYQPPVTDGGGNRQRGYALAALSGECRELAAQGEGNRNNRLNIAATKLGGFVTSGALSEEEVRNALRGAALAAGLLAGEIDRTLASGLRYGANEPRHVPERIDPGPATNLNGILTQPVAGASDPVPGPVLMIEDEDESPEGTPDDPGFTPPHLLCVPGFINSVMEYSLSVAPYPNRAMAFCGALALQAHLAARKVMDPSGLRTSLYILALAHSSAGKDQSRKVNASVLNAIGAAGHIGNKFSSAESLEDCLFTQPAMLFQNDEIDTMLLAIRAGKDTRYQAIMGALMEFFSTSSSIYTLRKKAGDTETRVIHQPALTLYGTATPKYYYAALNEQMLSNGFFSRMMVIESGKRGEGQEPPVAEVPKPIIEIARFWTEHPGQGNLNEQFPHPVMVKRSPEADRAIAAWRKETEAQYNTAEERNDEVAMSIWGRGSEIARKLALNYAVSENHVAPRIDIAAVEWGIEFTRHQLRRMIYMAYTHVAQNETHANKQRIFNIVKALGGSATKSQITKQTPGMRPRERDEAMADLLESGAVRIETVTTAGRPKTVIRAAICRV